MGNDRKVGKELRNYMDAGFNEAQRIEELENALGRVIEYLGRLPLHPMTRRAASEAECVLNSKTFFPQQYSASRFDPAGVLLLSVKARGKIIAINTASEIGDARFADHHRDMIYKLLVRGVEMPRLQADASL